MCDFTEDPEWTNERTPRARKPHRCFACREQIEVGHKYHLLIGRWFGEFDRFKHCLRCWEMLYQIQEYTQDAVQLNLNCGEVWEDPPENVAALAFMTGADLQDENKRRTPVEEE